ncbi:NAD(P)H-dependent glycerol-3-phosphate dehydrogenase [Papillibacter cinnamivorans]|uniref:Glycerol-3-phosphate dehydrogenase [NAD(P)+] n=1 Tax=Papillibacter cinnamivorans DSM 12816 TaxID=1122930 RepID=A0A1W1YMG7_9FIRM|nr:NAD(P)H-dependent glycerol-3-phosphate dehydrogenase [Papillibacter cinnamivorans]SMC37349.1 glycerol-3-phosphate dehydrogenase (NAD(P)+) [Papillibacter cinnamivorans DSM 12816]
MNISVLGSGGWGTALSLLLLENGHKVRLWSAFPEEEERLRSSGENPLLSGVPLSKDLEITSDITEISDSAVVVFAAPSFAVRQTAKKAAPHLAPDAVLVSVSKGIEKGSMLRLSQVIAQETGEGHPMVALSGPSHAEEVGRGVPTGCVAASVDRKAAEFVQDVFMCPRFRVYASPDIVGVELGAALKNVIALCSGVCDGMNCGDNTKAMLMTRGLAEIARLGAAMGGRRETFAGLAGVGDLIVTCTSMHSRNRRAGILIGQGVEPAEAVRRIGAVVEGYFAAEVAKSLSERYNVEMPISLGAYRVLYQGSRPETVLQELMTRSRKHEIEDSWT